MLGRHRRPDDRLSHARRDSLPAREPIRANRQIISVAETGSTCQVSEFALAESTNLSPRVPTSSK